MHYVVKSDNQNLVNKMLLRAQYYSSTKSIPNRIRRYMHYLLSLMLHNIVRIMYYIFLKCFQEVLGAVSSKCANNDQLFL